MKAIRHLSSQRGGRNTAANQFVELEFTNAQSFPVMNELPVLRVGNREFNLSRYPDTGETTSLIFTLTRAEYEQLKEGDDVTVQYGSGESANRRWHVGAFHKNAR